MDTRIIACPQAKTEEPDCKQGNSPSLVRNSFFAMASSLSAQDNRSVTEQSMYVLEYFAFPLKPL